FGSVAVGFIVPSTSTTNSPPNAQNQPGAPQLLPQGRKPIRSYVPSRSMVSLLLQASNSSKEAGSTSGSRPLSRKMSVRLKSPRDVELYGAPHMRPPKVTSAVSAGVN